MRLRWLKRVLCFALAITMLPAGSAFAKAAAKEKADYAQIFYDGEGENVNIQSYAFVEPANPTYVEKDGVQTLQISGGSSFYARISVAPTVFGGEKATPSKITVSYYDEGSGFMTLRYTNKDRSYKDAEKVVMTDTKTWKEYSFYLDDIIYKKSQGGQDFEITGWSESYGSSKAYYVRSVKIEKCDPKSPISFEVNSDRWGNIFSLDDEKLLNVKMENIHTKGLKSNIYYSVLDEYKNVLQEEQCLFESDFEAGETKTASLVPKVDKYGTYYISLRSENEYETENGTNVTKSPTQYFDFSVSNKFTEGEETNKNVGAIGHSGYPHFFDDIYKTSDMMADAGFGNMREEIRWEVVEKTKGVFDVGHEWITTVNQKQDLLMILAFFNYSYDNGAFPDDTYPNTKARFLEYVDTVTKKFKGQVKYYEFWNEPNLEVFVKQGTAESYAKTLQEVYKIVKKNDPEAQVVAFSTAQPTVSWIRKSLEAGALGYFDAVSTHPYDWDTKFDAKTYKEKMQSLHDLLEEFGIGDTPILLTEMGVSSAWNTPRTQAAQIVQGLALTVAEDIADKYYIYNFTEKGVAKGVENNFGIVKSLNNAVPNAAKDAYISVAGYNKMLANAELKDKIVKGDETFVYRFKNQNGKDVVMFWTEYGAETLGLNLGTDKCEMYDMETNKVCDLNASNGIFTVTTSFEPTYLVGDFSKLEEAEPVIKTNGGRLSVVKNDKIDIYFEDAQKRDLTIETQHNGNLMFAEKTDVKAGKGSLVYNVGDQINSEELLRVSLCEGDKCLYSALYHALPNNKPIEISGDCVAFSKDATGRYVAEITLKNTTSGIVLNGNINVKLHDEAGSEFKSLNVTNLKPGQSITLPYNLPKTSYRNPTRLDVESEFDSIENLSETFLIKPDLNCKYAQTTPNITGDYNPNEWKDGEWFSADNSYAAVSYAAWEGKNDASFVGTVKWDEKYLYLLVSVTDDVFYQPYEGNDSWKGDGLQIGIKNEIKAGLYGTNFTEMGLYKSKENIAKSWTWSGQFSTMSSLCYKNFDMRVDMVDGKYVYRAAIPWEDLVGTEQNPAEGDNIRLSVIYNDNDGSDRSWIGWNDGIAIQKNPDLFGRIKLVK